MSNAQGREAALARRLLLVPGHWTFLVRYSIFSFPNSAFSPGPANHRSVRENHEHKRDHPLVRPDPAVSAAAAGAAPGPRRGHGLGQPDPGPVRGALRERL